MISDFGIVDRYQAARARDIRRQSPLSLLKTHPRGSGRLNGYIAGLGADV